MAKNKMIMARPPTGQWKFFQFHSSQLRLFNLLFFLFIYISMFSIVAAAARPRLYYFILPLSLSFSYWIIKKNVLDSCLIFGLSFKIENRFHRSLHLHISMTCQNSRTSGKWFAFHWKCIFKIIEKKKRKKNKKLIWLGK